MAESDSVTAIRTPAPFMISGPEMKAEGKHFMKKKNSCDNSKYKCTSNEEEHQAQCNAALDTEQKRLGDCSEMAKGSLDWTSLSDYQQLGYNLRSNIFQGGPLKTRSLIKDSYTPDVIQKASRDPNNWHGRTINELGIWYEKYFLDLNTAKAMGEKYGDKKGKS